MSKKPDSQRHVAARNRRAGFDFHLEDRFEAGVALLGTEVKSLRSGLVSLDQAYGRVVDGEVWLSGLHINEYGSRGYANHRPRRERKLLLHRREIRKIEGLLEGGGKTLVPLEIAFNERGIAKVVIAVGTGKKHHDKRQTLREKSAKEEMRRAMRRG